MTETLTQVRTPYHELGDGSPRVPGWAQHRSVYRAAGRTLYRVETNSLDTAREDLKTLSSRGWEIHIDEADARATNISFSRKAA